MAPRPPCGVRGHGEHGRLVNGSRTNPPGLNVGGRFEDPQFSALPWFAQFLVLAGASRTESGSSGFSSNVKGSTRKSPSRWIVCSIVFSSAYRLSKRPVFSSAGDVARIAENGIPSRRHDGPAKAPAPALRSPAVRYNERPWFKGQSTG